MNKKGIETDTLIGLIAFVIVLAIVLTILFNIGNILGSKSNAEAVNTWVKARAASKGTDVLVSQIPPVIDLDKPLEIKSRDELLWSGDKSPKAYKEIANSMIDCWNAFERGKIDFLNAISKDTFCFPCRAVVFSDEIKKEETQMRGFNKYLNEQHTKGRDNQTYLQYLANDNFYTLEKEDLDNDVIEADKNLYIYFFAASGRGWANILSNVLGAGDIVPKIPSETETATPVVKSDGTADISAYRSGALLGGEILGKATLPTLAKKLTESANVPATAAAPTYEQILFKTAEREITPTTSKLILTVETKAGQKAVQGALGRSFGKILANNGVKFIAAKTFLPITIATGLYGGYQVVFGEKPFSAKILIVDQEKVYSLCNQ